MNISSIINHGLSRIATVSSIFLLGSAITSCEMIPQATLDINGPALAGQDVRLTILHTSDIHSRLLPYEFNPSFTDRELGLGRCQGPYGGMDRMAYIIKRERENAGRSLHLDSGDCFQGAIIFNEFQGEAEVRSMTATGLDAAVVGNHEFDSGAHNLMAQASAYAGYDLLAANYDFESADEPWAAELENLTIPSAIYELNGLDVGVIGLANLSSLNSIHDEDNSMGITVIPEYRVIPEEAAKLRSMGADIIVVVSHMGLDDDIEFAREFDEIDVIMGGHHHVAIDPPLVVTSNSGKRIPVVHSGAFAKFVGRLDLVIRDGEVLSHSYQLFPIDNTVPSDPEVWELLNEYSEQLDTLYDTSQVIGEATRTLTRYGSVGGDSMLGNFAAEAMRSWPGVETEISITNTLGIRSNIGRDSDDMCDGETGAWPITLDDLYNSMPFDNTITTMFLSGREVQEVLDFVSYRSADRGCNSQAQVAGIEFVMNCRDFVAEDVYINGKPLDPDGTYELATNNYIAHGGSGFSMLERNTTQYDTGISIRDVVRATITQYYSLPADTNGDGEEDVCVEDGRIIPFF
jgi:5'-nucleotidase / UDP-sugar diphosphatase